MSKYIVAKHICSSATIYAITDGTYCRLAVYTILKIASCRRRQYMPKCAEYERERERERERENIILMIAGNVLYK